ncbi:MAG: hypothetical protein R2874_14250 [Desulfobacterales bacterium]
MDETMRTTNSRVFAVGDCAATIQLARVADQEALVAASHVLKDMGRGQGQQLLMDYQAVPAVLLPAPNWP